MKKAVAALTAVIGANKANGLWEEGARMFCQVNLHRIPSLPNEKDTRVMVELEHSMWTDQTSICLLTPDHGEKKNQEDSIEHYQAKLKEAGVTSIGKIIPYDQLKKEHKGHELKRYLAKDYDVFLADSSISRLAGNHLGKEFYKRRKVPMAVDLTKTKGLQADLDKLAKSTQVIVTPRGANMNIAFGHSKMSDKELHANLKKLVGQFNTCIPRGQANVKSVTLQGTVTLAIPVYRNDAVDPKVDELSGMELERKAGHEQLKELRAEIKKKTKRPMKKKKAKTIKSKSKRKLMKTEQDGASSETAAKKMKVETE